MHHPPHGMEAKRAITLLHSRQHWQTPCGAQGVWDHAQPKMQELPSRITQKCIEVCETAINSQSGWGRGVSEIAGDGSRAAAGSRCGAVCSSDGKRSRALDESKSMARPFTAFYTSVIDPFFLPGLRAEASTPSLPVQPIYSSHRSKLQLFGLTRPVVCTTSSPDGRVQVRT
jgi:hypothetical protein